MAESAVSLAVDRLVPFLVEEVKQLKKVPVEVRSITNDLDFIRGFLRDADERAATEKDVKAWVKQVRQAAFGMEDVLDEFRLRIAQQPLRRGFLGWVRKTFGSPKRLKPRHVVATDLQDIKASLVEINEKRKDYGFVRTDLDEAGSSSSKSSIACRDGSLYLGEWGLVGIQTGWEVLIDCLLEGETKKTIFALVGAEGVGKTTLFNAVYESLPVKKYFEYRTRIYCSESMKIKELLVKWVEVIYKDWLKESIPLEIYAMETTQLIRKVSKFLHDKRYVAVLDDVQNLELWNSLKDAFSDNHNGSRILVTTRSDDVARSIVTSSIHVYHLDPLPLKDALILFYKKAFASDFEGQCPPELVEVSKELVKKSGRLPMAIELMGGLLSTKEKTVFEWNKFCDALSSKLPQGPDPRIIKQIISLSYSDLPYYLKSCFLYFGVFPVNHPVSSIRLTCLWIAEGFVKETKGKTLEDVAEDYLDQLIARSLVHVDVIDGNIRTCKVHPRIHEFILFRLKEENFCQVINGESNGKSSNESTRRVSFQNSSGGGNDKEVSTNSSSDVCSVFVFCFLNKLPSSLMHTLRSSFMLIKVLVLADAPLAKFPPEVTDLHHLRYLDLGGTSITTLPKALGKLQNLEILNLSHTFLVELPLAILKLKKLRHLIAYRRRRATPSYSMCEAVQVPEGIGRLTDLQTLMRIDGNQGPGIISDLGKLTELRELSVNNLKRANGTELCASVAKMNCLRILGVASGEGEKPSEAEVDTDPLPISGLDIQNLSSPPLQLQELYLTGRLEQLPSWISSLHNLLKINLICSKLRNDPMNILRGLPNLLQIYINDYAYDGEKLQILYGGFQKLRGLYLCNLDKLHLLLIEKGSVPVLEHISISGCKQLKVVPTGITHLAKLRSIRFCDMPKEFTIRLAQDGGLDYWKIMHIPEVYIK